MKASRFRKEEFKAEVARKERDQKQKFHQARLADKADKIEKRAAVKRKMTKTTRKGQPNFGASMEVILEKLKSAQ